MGDRAHTVVKELAEGDQLWAIPWPCCYEFLSVVTNRRIWRDAATTPERAWQQFSAWMASPSNRMIGETEAFADVLRRFVLRPRVVGGVVRDARIAAICVAHGVEASSRETAISRCSGNFPCGIRLPSRSPRSS